MLRHAAVLALVFGFSNLAVASSPVFVADGDCAALDAAIASAGSTGETTIMLAHGGTYAQCGVDVQHGRVRIEVRVRPWARRANAARLSSTSQRAPR